MTENRSPEAAEMAAEYEAERVARSAVRDANVRQAEAQALAMFQSGEVERAKASVLGMVAALLGTALVFGIVVGATLYFRWVA